MQDAIRKGGKEKQNLLPVSVDFHNHQPHEQESTKQWGSQKLQTTQRLVRKRKHTHTHNTSSKIISLVARILLSIFLHKKSNLNSCPSDGNHQSVPDGRRWQKLGTRSMHWYTGGSTLRLDLTQSLHAGWHPRGAASRHWHRGGTDLVHPPQHGHDLALAGSPPLPTATKRTNDSSR
jgi:hypothetical protein